MHSLDSLALHLLPVANAFETIGNGFGGFFGLLGLIFLIWGVVSVVRSSLSTGPKVLWVIAAVIFPFLGPLCWLIFGGQFRRQNA